MTLDYLWAVTLYEYSIGDNKYMVLLKKHQEYIFTLTVPLQIPLDMTENWTQANYGGGQGTSNRTKTRTVRPISIKKNQWSSTGESKQPKICERHVLNTKLKYISKVLAKCTPSMNQGTYFEFKHLV
jgi:hypothetical protein